MRSLRLDHDADGKIRRAAAIRGISVSEFIRHAAMADAEETLAVRPGGQFADVAGAIHGGGGRARHTGEAFTDAVVQDRAGG
jgi:hypothetical protein